MIVFKKIRKMLLDILIIALKVIGGLIGVLIVCAFLYGTYFKFTKLRPMANFYAE